MHLSCERKFEKDLAAIVDKNILKQIEVLLQHLAEAEGLHEIGQVKVMKGHPGYYRIRIGDYRIGLRLDEKGVVLLRVLHRKDIYRKFP